MIGVFGGRPVSVAVIDSPCVATVPVSCTHTRPSNHASAAGAALLDVVIVHWTEPLEPTAGALEPLADSVPES